MKGSWSKLTAAALVAAGLTAGVAFGVAQAQPGPGQGQGQQVQAQAGACDPQGVGMMQRGPRGGVGQRGEMLTEVAAWLGISVDQLTTELQGKSLTDVAVAHGKTQAQLVQFVAAEMTEHIDEALAAGRITAERAATLKEGVTARAQAMAERVHQVGVPGQPGQGQGRGPRFGR